jgi:hypothetical protein
MIASYIYFKKLKKTCIYEGGQKDPIKYPMLEPSHERKKGRPKKGQKTCSPQEQNKGEN